MRYLSTHPQHHVEDTVENLALEVQVGQEILSNLSFPVTIQRATVWMLRLEPLHTQDTQQDTLTTAHLEATPEEAGPSPPTFHYEVVQAPRKGSLQLQGTRLSGGQGFTQDDVQAGQVHLSGSGGHLLFLCHNSSIFLPALYFLHPYWQ